VVATLRRFGASDIGWRFRTDRGGRELRTAQEWAPCTICHKNV